MKPNGLEIATDLKHQKRLWFVERLGWSIMGLVIVAALCGLFGNGVLSKATAGTPGSALQVRYERFGRYEAPTELEAHIGPGEARGDTLRLWLSRDYLDSVEVERTVPAPDFNEVEATRIVYVFKLSRSNEPARVTFHLRPKEYGKATARLGVVGGPDVPFSQFFYP